MEWERTKSVSWVNEQPGQNEKPGTIQFFKEKTVSKRSKNVKILTKKRSKTHFFLLKTVLYRRGTRNTNLLPLC